MGDKHKVRDVIINRMEIKCYSKILELKEPKEILAKLREYKRLEIKTTGVKVKRELFNLKYNPKRKR